MPGAHELLHDLAGAGRQLRAKGQEVAEALGVAILMNGGPGTVWGPRAYSAWTTSEPHASVLP